MKTGQLSITWFILKLQLLWDIHLSNTRTGLMRMMKIKLRSFKSSERINEKGNGPYRGFGYLSLFSDPINLVINVG